MVYFLRNFLETTVILFVRPGFGCNVLGTLIIEEDLAPEETCGWRWSLSTPDVFLPTPSLCLWWHLEFPWELVWQPHRERSRGHVNILINYRIIDWPVAFVVAFVVAVVILMALWLGIIVSTILGDQLKRIVRGRQEAGGPFLGQSLLPPLLILDSALLFLQLSLWDQLLIPNGSLSKGVINSLSKSTISSLSNGMIGSLSKSIISSLSKGMISSIAAASKSLIATLSKLPISALGESLIAPQVNHQSLPWANQLPPQANCQWLPPWANHQLPPRANCLRKSLIDVLS